MRLPSIKARQRNYEDTRMIHERIWESHLESKPVVISLVAEQTALQLQRRLNGSCRKFWIVRGYRLRTKSFGRVLHVWLEEARGDQETAA